MRTVSNNSAVLLALFFAAAIVGVLAFINSSASAGEAGLTGFVLCTSKAPKELGYVQGDRVYLSGVFHANTNEPYEQAFAAFLKHKYDFGGPLNCSIAWAEDGQVKTLKQRAQMAGSLAVRTGWTFTSAGAAPAPRTPAPLQHKPSQTSQYFFVCTWPSSAAGVLTFYVSDVNGTPAGADPGPFLGKLASAFGHFVTSKYHASGGGYNCVYQFSQAAAEALKNRYLTSWTPKGYKAVYTGWKYGEAN